MGIAKARAEHTVEEYYDLEENEVYKSEFRDGEIIPMEGRASLNRSKLTCSFRRPARTSRSTNATVTASGSSPKPRGLIKNSPSKVSASSFPCGGYDRMKFGKKNS